MSEEPVNLITERWLCMAPEVFHFLSVGATAGRLPLVSSNGSHSNRRVGSGR